MDLNVNKYCVKFFSVGKDAKGGDAILVELFDNEDYPVVVLIDGGYKETGEIICDYLKKRYKKPRIDWVINTHPDKDHISGLKIILEDEKIEVCNIGMNRPWRDSGLTIDYFKDKRITEDSLVERIKDAFSLADDIECIAQKRKIKIFPLLRGTELIRGVLTILGPSKEFYKKHLLISDKTPITLEDYDKQYYRKKEVEEEDYDIGSGRIIEWYDDEQTSAINQTSLILMLALGKECFLFTGDAGKEAMVDALNYYESLNCKNKSSDFTIVQLPHHGSRKNINPKILERLSPINYIISCPPDGMKEGHPSRRLINKILEMNSMARIYVTQTKNFLFYKNVDVLCKPQKPQKQYLKMDGKSK